MKIACNNQKGVILAPVMGIMAILLALAISYLSQSGDDTAILRNDRRAIEAFYTMEAGLEDAIHELLQNPSWRTGFSEKAFHTGNYTVSVVESGSNLEIRSTGTVTGSRARATTTAITQIAPGSFRYMLQADGNVNASSTTGIFTGDILADNVNLGDMSLEGSSSTDTEDEIPVPDWSQWEASATTLISGNYTFAAGTYSGIWYVDGSVTIESDVTISGTVAATGNIKFLQESNILILSGPTNTAMIAQGNIDANGASDVYVDGLLYAAGNVIFNNQENTTYNGIIFAGGNVNMNSGDSITLTYDSDLAVNFPSYFTDPDGLGIEVIAWK